MAYVLPLLTVDQLNNEVPDDGKRREIIDGELYVSAAPAREHQEFSGDLYSFLREYLRATGWGKVYYSPVDVKFSNVSQVQPDLIVLRRDHLKRYQGHTVDGPPDIVVEILSPSNRSYDLQEKANLYARYSVPEYWVADPLTPSFQMLVLTDGQYVPVTPDDAGLLHSTVVPGLVVDPAALFAELES
jgi:Uma2 family endonuclease